MACAVIKLVIADDHKGLRAAARRVFNATHQRCRVNWIRNAPAKQRTAVAAMLKTIFAQDTKAEAEAQWAVVADALRERQPKLGALMDASRDNVLAYMFFPNEHWTQIASTNLARLPRLLASVRPPNTTERHSRGPQTVFPPPALAYPRKRHSRPAAKSAARSTAPIREGSHRSISRMIGWSVTWTSNSSVSVICAVLCVPRMGS